jgi:hypothetical protein
VQLENRKRKLHVAEVWFGEERVVGQPVRLKPFSLVEQVAEAEFLDHASSASVFPSCNIN